VVPAKKHQTSARKEIDNNTKRQPEICQGEPRKGKREYVILTTNINEGTRDQLNMTHKGLDVEEEHPDDTMARLVKSEEVHDSIL